MLTKDLENKILSISLLNQDYFVDCLGYSTEKFLTGESLHIFEQAKNYFTGYSKVPGYVILEQLIEAQKYDEEKELSLKKRIDEIRQCRAEQGETVKYLVDLLKEETRKKKLVESLKTSIELFKEKQFDEIEKQYEEYLLFKKSIESDYQLVQGEVAEEALADLFEYYEDMDKEPVPGILTGIRELDELTNGIFGGELALVAARPAVGKSTFLLNVAFFNYFYHNKNILYVSLEMPKKQVKRRLYSRASNLPYTKIKKVELDETELAAYEKTLKEIAQRKDTGKGIFHIIDIPNAISSATLEVHIQTAMRDFSIDLVVVDYLGCMLANEKQTSKWEVQGNAALELRALARKYKVPIWTATQLNRDTAKSKTVDSSNIAYSDMIAQITDLAIGLSETEEDLQLRQITCTLLKIRDAEKIAPFKFYANKEVMLMASGTSSSGFTDIFA